MIKTEQRLLTDLDTLLDKNITRLHCEILGANLLVSEGRRLLREQANNLLDRLIPWPSQRNIVEQS